MTILMVPACDKMPLVAPTGTTITLYASSLTVGLNGSIDITANVIESAGTPVQNGTVVYFTTTLGTIEPAEARTNNGTVTVRFVAGTRSGTAEIRAFSGGVSTGDASTTGALKVSVGAAAAAKVDLLANPSALPASGGVVQLTAVVNDSSGNRLSGVPVSFTTDAGVLAQTSVTSDGNGEARSSLSTTAKSRVTASIVGGTGTAGALTASLDIPVRVGPTVTISTPTASLVPGVAATFTVSVTAGGAAVRTAIIEFGDGGSQAVATAGVSTAVHAYGNSGTFIVTAVATDAAGETTTATASVSVQPVIVAVSISVSPATVTTSVPAQFSAIATTTPAGAAIERYEWDFGDGFTRTTSGSSTTHQYVVGGGRRYFVTVRAVTTKGASGTGQIDFVVQ
jgi:predicted enzyme related to lactoylglutathione lyase